MVDIPSPYVVMVVNTVALPDNAMGMPQGSLPV